jgi:hypothetical protein
VQIACPCLASGNWTTYSLGCVLNPHHQALCLIKLLYAAAYTHGQAKLEATQKPSKSSAAVLRQAHVLLPKSTCSYPTTARTGSHLATNTPFYYSDTGSGWGTVVHVP